MRRASSLAVVGLVAVALWLGWRVMEFRRERSLAENGLRDALRAVREVDLGEPDSEAMPALSRAEVEESTEDEEAERETCLRGLILDARRETPLKGCKVLLSFGEQSLANATSDDDGRFEIRFNLDDFRDVAESRPDLYLRVFDRSGLHEIHQTTDAIRWNASTLERYTLRIPARALRTPGNS